ncbi:hypothetical protein M422DRAFT_257593 [Sphaerobolus stellatus SS14]|uniref:Uncharacterized protein n=1 Tax=Sphaerobolus stellatus (strain SS14) TaxID=990650 RepID=A0A0C9VP08_SPHS4|nr:hypothetical protein M422DRAFT_257593 [Sphaerobolus stellatus SS14]
MPGFSDQPVEIFDNVHTNLSHPKDLLSLSSASRRAASFSAICTHLRNDSVRLFRPGGPPVPPPTPGRSFEAQSISADELAQLRDILPNVLSSVGNLKRFAWMRLKSQYVDLGAGGNAQTNLPPRLTQVSLLMVELSWDPVTTEVFLSHLIHHQPQIQKFAMQQWMWNTERAAFPLLLEDAHWPNLTHYTLTGRYIERFPSEYTFGDTQACMELFLARHNFFSRSPC